MIVSPKALVVVIVLGVLIPATLAWAGAVWRLEVDETVPTAQESLTTWQRLSRWLTGRARGPRPPIGSTFTVESSAYAPSPYQTDATPCITAAGTRVRPGVVASNMLPFGTVLKAEVEGLEAEYFIVEDRMASRFQNHIDIWFPATSEALQFGRRSVEFEVVGYSTPGESLALYYAVQRPDTIAKGPSFLERIGLRAQSLGRSLSRYIGANVNQHDVDCFRATALEG